MKINTSKMAIIFLLFFMAMAGGLDAFGYGGFSDFYTQENQFKITQPQAVKLIEKNLDQLVITKNLPLAVMEDAARKALVNDFITKGSNFLNGFEESLIDSWKILHEFKSTSFVKTDVARLKIFKKLNSDKQKLIRQFTDVDANSTLSKFLDDCNSDPDFLIYINNPDNALIVKGFLSHKPAVKALLTTDELNTLGDLIKSTDEISNPNVRKWLEHSDNINTLRKYADQGIAFGNRIKSELSSGTSEAYLVLKQRLAGFNPPLNLDDYSIYSQIQLCLKGNCIDKGEYWIPDFLLVAERNGPAGKYLEVIVVDAKLSRGTDWTPNQKEADLLLNWKIKSVSGNNLIKGSNLNLEIDFNLLRNGKFIKLFEEVGILKTDFKNL